MRKLLLKKSNIMKDDFSYFSVFSAIILFLVFSIGYRQVGSSLILAILYYFFLKITHFIFLWFFGLLKDINDGKIEE